LYGIKNRISDTSLAEFRKSKIYGKYTPLDLHDLIRIMDLHPDIRIIIDTKGDLTYMFSKFKNAVIKVNPDIMNRIVPQMYFENDYYRLMKIYPFREIIYTLYLSDASDLEVADFIKNKQEIKAVTVNMKRFTSRLAKLLNGMGKHVFVNTINYSWQVRLFSYLGAYGFYTDNLHAKIND
jgi:glycerophosphoryl diester phosphodiesterase